jgi:hypothetical protein
MASCESRMLDGASVAEHKRSRAVAIRCKTIVGIYVEMQGPQWRRGPRSLDGPRESDTEGTVFLCCPGVVSFRHH